MTVVAFILFLITFICRVISGYSNQQVGSGTERVIDNNEAHQIGILCFGSNTSLSSSGSLVTEIFSIGGSLWVSCSIVLALVDQCFDVPGNSRFAKNLQSLTRQLKDEIIGITIPILAFIIWGVPLFWALMTLRSWQMVFAASLDEQSGRHVWSFGQIIAVIVFLPVPNELFHQYLERSKPYNRIGQQQASTVHVVVRNAKYGGAQGHELNPW